MSRLVEGKGVEIAARAAKLLVDRERRDFKLTFAGDGPLLGWLQEFLSENEVGDCVEAYGYASGEDKDRLLRGADIFLLPTQLPEGCPVAIIEAMGAGQAVVTTPRGAIPSLVTDGRNGLLRDSGDPKEFADAVTLLIDDRRLLATIQATNKREAEELYEVSRYSARMERVYDSIVQGQIGTLGSDSHPALR
jgi:glycosyltransferase involved in cell wall biosynthesis